VRVFAAGLWMGCAFCATGRLGLKRNLRAERSSGRCWAAQRASAPQERISNVGVHGNGRAVAQL